MENNSLNKHAMTRRKFLWLTSMSAAGFAIGCAIDPVTGKKTFSLVSEDQEIELDREAAPHQFSQDYGALQDNAANKYIARVGKKLVPHTHRPDMPYSFRGVNSVRVNAYAFPGGSIAVTRGMLLELSNEAELAGLLGHEIGHVCARHGAEQRSKLMVAENILNLGMAYMDTTEYAEYSDLAGMLAAGGAGALLCAYSRENEREADDLGNQYMVKAGFNPSGFVGLMNILKNMSQNASWVVRLLFATHPMSDERYRASVENAETKYKSAQNLPTNEERYMANTEKFRKMEEAIKAMQDGEEAMAEKKYSEAEKCFKKALKKAPRDYAGLLMMSKCQLAQKKSAEGQRYAERAVRLYPTEAQARYLCGVAKQDRKLFDSAYRDFKKYGELLPGNSNIAYLKGFCLDKMGRKNEAATEYNEYLESVRRGGRIQAIMQMNTEKQAGYAYHRLIEWGHIKPKK